MPTDAEKVVTEFCNAWPRKNLDELLGFFTDDCDIVRGQKFADRNG